MDLSHISTDILFYNLFTCVYRANVFRLSEMIQQQGIQIDLIDV